MNNLDGLRPRTRAFDPVNYLETESDMTAHLQAALMDGEARILAAALGKVARARGMAQLAKDTGLTRENLYLALSDKGRLAQRCPPVLVPGPTVYFVFRWKTRPDG